MIIHNYLRSGLLGLIMFLFTRLHRGALAFSPPANSHSFNVHFHKVVLGSSIPLSMTNMEGELDETSQSAATTSMKEEDMVRAMNFARSHQGTYINRNDVGNMPNKLVFAKTQPYVPKKSNTGPLTRQSMERRKLFDLVLAVGVRDLAVATFSAGLFSQVDATVKRIATPADVEITGTAPIDLVALSVLASEDCFTFPKLSFEHLEHRLPKLRLPSWNLKALLQQLITGAKMAEGQNIFSRVTASIAFMIASITGQSS